MLCTLRVAAIHIYIYIIYPQITKGDVVFAQQLTLHLLKALQGNSNQLSMPLMTCQHELARQYMRACASVCAHLRKRPGWVVDIGMWGRGESEK